MVRGFVQVVRALVRDPAHAVVAILTLALGIGATTAVFCVLDGVLLRPLPYPQADRLVRVFHTAPGLDLVEDLGLSDATYFRLRESGVFDGLAIYREGAVNLSGTAAPERVPAAWVSPSLTATLGVAPILGRPLRTEDARPGADPVALVGERLWRRRFGGAPGVIGERVRIDGVEREIVGVLPQELRFPDPETRVWLPLALDPAATTFGELGPLPGVESAGAGGTLPLEGRLDGAGVSIEDHPDPPGAMAKVHFHTQASRGYFETLGIPLVAGRPFTRADTEQRRGVVVVSESFARHYWPNGTAVGKRIQPRSGEPSPEGWYTIVGVVGDVRMTRLEDPPQEMIYWPLVSLPRDRPGHRDSFEARAMQVVLRTNGDPMDLVPAVRSRVRSLDPHLPIADVQTVGTLVARAKARRAFVMTLLAIGALAALLVGAVGVYAVVSYLVTLRTREIGVRMALRATRRRVVALVAARSIGVGAAGALFGVAASFLLGRFMGSVLYRVEPHDPWTLIAAVGAVAAAVTLASVLPARRAAGIDPAEVMRAE